jgi:hypothetical protein
MTQVPSDRRHSARIASLVPGRLRIKLRRGDELAGLLQRLKSRLEGHEGVHRVKVNPTVGSLTLHYDHARHGMAGVLGWLEDVDVMVESIGHLPSVNGAEGVTEAGFVGAAEDLNRRIHHWTGLPVDIKLLLPLLFLAAGLWSTARKGLMVEAVPGWLFLWFAFDVFVKFHPPAHSRAKVPVPPPEQTPV